MAFFVWLIPAGLASGANSGLIRHAAFVRKAVPGYALSPALYWSGGWAIAPSIPVAGDIEGSRRADLISVNPKGDGEIGIIHTSRIGKPVRYPRALTGFGGGAVAAACGRFAGQSADAVVVVLASGEVHAIYDVQPDADGKLKFRRDDTAAAISPTQMPAGPLEAIAADFDGDGAPDLLLIGSDGRSLLLRKDKTNPSAGVHLEVLALAAPFPAHRQVTAGTLADAPDTRARLFYITDAGTLLRTAVSFSPKGDSPRFVAGFPVLTAVDVNAKMVAGHFMGAAGIDLLVGQTLFPSCDPALRSRLDSLPAVGDAQSDRTWIAADFDGNGKEDLLRACGPASKNFKDVALIQFSTNPEREPAPGYYASANDGLPDAWKLGLIKPGGLDLQALGCRVGHHDLVAEILPMADVPQTKLHEVLDAVAAHYAAMPIPNLDGTQGIAVHFIFRDPIPVADRDYRKWNDPSDFWATMWPKYVVRSHIGIVHYMGMQNGSAGFGGGFKSWCGDGWPEFIHEMGHQLGLGHEGGDGLQPMSAVYPSLMNYSYSYGINGNQKAIGYSIGALRSLGILNEEHLNETLPLPYASVKFLSGPPYHFHLKPGSDPDTTLIDWNWNGVFGESDVRADLSYSHGIRIDPEFEVGTSACSPIVATQKASQNDAERLLLFAEPADSGSPNNRRLTVRVWLGTDRDRDGRRWSRPVTVAEDAATGDPAATSITGATFVAFPTSSGIKICRIALGASDKVEIGDPMLLPRTVGVQASLISCGNGAQIAIFLWRGPKAPVALRLLNIGAGGVVDTNGSERKLSFASEVPVSVVAGATNSLAGAGSFQPLWVAHMPPDSKTRDGSQFLVTRLALSANAAATEDTARLVHGNYAVVRPTLLWEPDPGMGPEGRLYLIASGAARRGSEDAVGGEVLAMQTAYPQEDGGWQVRHYGARSETMTTESAPGACWFMGNMVLVERQNTAKKETQDVVSLTFRGTGATPQPVADYDDIQHIINSGLRRSLEYAEEP